MIISLFYSIGLSLALQCLENGVEAMTDDECSVINKNFLFFSLRVLLLVLFGDFLLFNS